MLFETSTLGRSLGAALLLFVLTPPLHAEERTLEIALIQGKISGEEDTIRVTQGDQMKLTITSDTRLELHLHGYDREIPVGPEAPALLELEADLGGRFPVEAHGGSHDDHVIFYLEVYPD